MKQTKGMDTCNYIIWKARKIEKLQKKYPDWTGEKIEDFIKKMEQLLATTKKEHPDWDDKKLALQEEILETALLTIITTMPSLDQEKVKVESKKEEKKSDCEVRDEKQKDENPLDLKYEILMDNSIMYGKHKLYRIRALKSFGDVRKGEIGGYVESVCNLSQKGTCWIYDDAKACGFSQIRSNAKLKGNAIAEGYAIVQSSAIVKDQANVMAKSVVKDYAIVKDCAKILSTCNVQGKAVISGNACVGSYTIVKDRAIVKDDVKINAYALIEGHAEVSGNVIINASNVRISDHAKVSGDVLMRGHNGIIIKKNAEVSENTQILSMSKGWEVRITDHAKVYGNAILSSGAFIRGNAKVHGNAKIAKESEINDHAEIFGNAFVEDYSEIYDQVKICGSAHVKNAAKISGNAVVTGETTIIDGHKVKSFYNNRFCEIDRSYKCYDRILQEYAVIKDMITGVLDNPVFVLDRSDDCVYAFATQSDSARFVIIGDLHDYTDTEECHQIA